MLAAKVGERERAGAEEAFWRMAGQEMCASLEVMWVEEVMWADGGFESQEWQARMEQKFGFEIEVITRSDCAQGFELLPKRWVVERSFGWMNYTTAA